MIIWITDSWANESGTVGRTWDILWIVIFFFKLFFLRYFTIFLLCFTWDWKKRLRGREGEWDSDGKTSFACLIIRIPRTVSNSTNFCVFVQSSLSLFVLLLLLLLRLHVVPTFYFCICFKQLFPVFLSPWLNKFDSLWPYFHDGTEITERFMVIVLGMFLLIFLWNCVFVYVGIYQKKRVFF